MGKEGDLVSEPPLSQLLEALIKMHKTAEREEESRKIIIWSGVLHPHTPQPVISYSFRRGYHVYPNQKG